MIRIGRFEFDDDDDDDPESMDNRNAFSLSLMKSFASSAWFTTLLVWSSEAKVKTHVVSDKEDGLEMIFEIFFPEDLNVTKKQNPSSGLATLYTPCFLS